MTKGRLEKLYLDGELATLENIKIDLKMKIIENKVVLNLNDMKEVMAVVVVITQADRELKEVQDIVGNSSVAEEMMERNEDKNEKGGKNTEINTEESKNMLKYKTTHYLTNQFKVKQIISNKKNKQKHTKKLHKKANLHKLDKRNIPDNINELEFHQNNPSNEDLLTSDGELKDSYRDVLEGKNSPRLLVWSRTGTYNTDRRWYCTQNTPPDKWFVAVVG